MTSSQQWQRHRAILVAIMIAVIAALVGPLGLSMTLASGPFG